MDRRKFLAVSSSGFSLSIVGCLNDPLGTDNEESEQDESEDATFPRHEKENMQEEYYDMRVEDEMLVKSHNLTAFGIEEILNNKLIAEAVRRGTAGSEMDQRTSRAEVGVTPLAPLLSSASTGSYTAC